DTPVGRHTSLFGAEKHGLMKPSCWRQTQLKGYVWIKRHNLRGYDCCWRSLDYSYIDNANGWRTTSGSAHVFVRSGEEWTHQAKLLAPDVSASGYFGDCVAIYEDAIVIGAYKDDDNGYNSGSAHVFAGTKGDDDNRDSQHT
ncbi:hypothetical protein THAOC_34130, partial [Thalassiosira oceanica]